MKTIKGKLMGKCCTGKCAYFKNVKDLQNKKSMP